MGGKRDSAVTLHKHTCITYGYHASEKLVTPSASPQCLLRGGREEEKGTLRFTCTASENQTVNG